MSFKTKLLIAVAKLSPVNRAIEDSHYLLGLAFARRSNALYFLDSPPLISLSPLSSNGRNGVRLPLVSSGTAETAPVYPLSPWDIQRSHPCSTQLIGVIDISPCPLVPLRSLVQSRLLRFLPSRPGAQRNYSRLDRRPRPLLGRCSANASPLTRHGGRVRTPPRCTPAVSALTTDSFGTVPLLRNQDSRAYIDSQAPEGVPHSSL